MKILMGIFAVISFIGMIADENKETRKNCTLAFIAAVFAELTLYLL